MRGRLSVELVPFNLVPNECCDGGNDSVIDKVRSGVSCMYLPVIKSLIADDIRLTIYNDIKTIDTLTSSIRYYIIQSYLVYDIT